MANKRVRKDTAELQTKTKTEADEMKKETSKEVISAPEKADEGPENTDKDVVTQPSDHADKSTAMD